jgi:hypothetical protein
MAPRRPCGIFMPGGKCPICYIGELGPVEPAKRDVPNLGPRVTIVDNTGKRLSRLGGWRAGLGIDQFLAPHGLCVDSGIFCPPSTPFVIRTNDQNRTRIVTAACLRSAVLPSGNSLNFISQPLFQDSGICYD